MRWIKKWLGILSPLEKKKKIVLELHKDAFLMQRNGNLRKAGELLKKAKDIEDEIVQEESTND